MLLYKCIYFIVWSLIQGIFVIDSFETHVHVQNSGIIIVCGESIFVDFVGYPYPWIYILKNVLNYLVMLVRKLHLHPCMPAKFWQPVTIGLYELEWFHSISPIIHVPVNPFWFENILGYLVLKIIHYSRCFCFNLACFFFIGMSCFDPNVLGKSHLPGCRAGLVTLIEKLNERWWYNA